MKNKIPLNKKTKTRVFSENGKTKVQYHDTVVIEWDAQTITLNSGGWMTSTTKARINQASDDFNLGIGVRQENFEWFICLKNPKYGFDEFVPYWLPDEIPFQDGITLQRVHFGRQVVPFVAIEGVLK
jgi:hypothetical protein